MAIVTAAELAVPTVTNTGVDKLAAILAGTVTLICITPDTNPGASPAYCTEALTPPMVTETGSTGFGQIDAVTLPSFPGGFVCPSPVKYNVTIDPRAAGAVAELIAPS